MNYTIGKYCIIEDDTLIGENVIIGDYVKVMNGSIIGDDVIIGDYSRITGPCKILKGANIRARTTIAPGFVIGKNTFIGGSVTTTRSNKIKPDSSQPIKHSLIGNNCKIGSNVTIVSGADICDDVEIGAGAVVIKPITEPGLYVGNPARKIR